MVVYSGGSFDVLHIGHVDLLRWCRDLAGENGKVVISLNTDRFIEEFKGKKPVMSYQERKDMLLSLKLVDEVVVNEEGKDSTPTILKVKPDVIVVGSDWLQKDYFKQMGFTPEWLEKHRISLCYIPRFINMSSTEIKRRMK